MESSERSKCGLQLLRSLSRIVLSFAKTWRTCSGSWTSGASVMNPLAITPPRRPRRELLYEPHRVNRVDQGNAGDYHLRRPSLNVADKVPLKAVAEQLLLADEFLRPVLPNEV